MVRERLEARAMELGVDVALANSELAAGLTHLANQPVHAISSSLFLVLNHRPDRLRILLDRVSFSFALWLIAPNPARSRLPAFSSVLCFTNSSVMCFAHATCCASSGPNLLNGTVTFSCSRRCLL